VVEVDEDTGQARVAGPIDLNTVEKLRPVMLHATRGGIRALTVDLSAVTVLSSAGVQLLHDLAATAPD
jgi:anti-anti-sigma factor